MEAVRETTVWTGVDFKQPNHDYLLDGDRVVAYRPWGTAEIRIVKSNLKIDRRGRKFEKLKENPFRDLQLGDRGPEIREVQGSKGQIYRVDVEAKSCTCPGFTFRGACKHVSELRE